MPSHLLLFHQVPLHSKFKFGDRPQVYVKSSGEGAHSDGAFYPVHPDVLVFAVPDPVVIAELRTLGGREYLALKHPDGKWGIYSRDAEAVLGFNSLEDVINHLGA
jgi:hypothetical protein